MRSRVGYIGAVLTAFGCLYARQLLGALPVDEEKYIDGLRTRRLYSLVEAYCREQLSSQPTPEREARLTIALIRSEAAHALQVPQAQRSKYWDKASSIAADFVASHPAHPRLLLIRVQQALTHLARGELLRQELEADVGRKDTRERALAEIREAANQLGELDRELAKLIPRASGKTPRGGELSFEELRSLGHQVRFQLARAYRNRALCYDLGSVDRIDALSRAIEQDENLLREIATEDPLRWQIQLDTIVCRRLSGKMNDARTAINALSTMQTPPPIRLRVQAEVARYLIAADRAGDAASLLNEARHKAPSANAPDFDFATLEAFVALQKASKDEAEQKRLQQRSVELRDFIEQTYGPYWGRRATLLVVRNATSGSPTNNLQILIQVAEEAWRKKQYDDALRAYDEAATVADKSGDTAQSFELAYKAALIEQQQAHFAAAAERLRDLAIDKATLPAAAKAHLLSAWNYSQQARADRNAMATYIDVLEEHISTWPAGSSADTARNWLGRIREFEKAWTEAIALYLDVATESPMFEEAVTSASRAAFAQLDQIRLEQQPTADQAELLAAQFEDLLLDEQRQPTGIWNPATRTAALTAGKLRLQFTQSERERVANYLRSALDGSPGADGEWRAAVSTLLVVALASQEGMGAEAQRVLREISDGSAAELQRMLQSLSQIRKQATGNAAKEIASLELSAVELLLPKRAELSASQQLELDRSRAAALAASGRQDEAMTAYSALAKTHADHGPIQEEYGQLLLSGQTRETLEKALAQWRRIAVRSKPQTDRWFRAKYASATAQCDLSDLLRTADVDSATKYREQAARMLTLMKETPPGWDNSSLKPKFESLLRRCLN